MTNRELDKAVAEHVFGWTNIREGDKMHWGTPPGCLPTFIPAYSTDPGAANQLREKLLEPQYVNVGIDGSHYHGDTVAITAPHPSQQPEGRVLLGTPPPGIWGETWMQALCWAALFHVGATTIEEYSDSLDANQADEPR